MRLIDADALLEQIVKLNNVYVQGRMAYIIDNQPTAYDVEKVVAGIEEFYEEAEHYGFTSALSDIVEVVKWGGVK